MNVSLTTSTTTVAPGQTFSADVSVSNASSLLPIVGATVTFTLDSVNYVGPCDGSIATATAPTASQGNASSSLTVPGCYLGSEISVTATVSGGSYFGSNATTLHVNLIGLAGFLAFVQVFPFNLLTFGTIMLLAVLIGWRVGNWRKRRWAKSSAAASAGAAVTRPRPPLAAGPPVSGPKPAASVPAAGPAVIGGSRPVPAGGVPRSEATGGSPTATAPLSPTAVPASSPPPAVVAAPTAPPLQTAAAPVAPPMEMPVRGEATPVVETLTPVAPPPVPAVPAVSPPVSRHRSLDPLGRDRTGLGSPVGTIAVPAQRVPCSRGRPCRSGSPRKVDGRQAGRAKVRSGRGASGGVRSGSSSHGVPVDLDRGDGLDGPGGEGLPGMQGHCALGRAELRSLRFAALVGDRVGPGGQT